MADALYWTLKRVLTPLADVYFSLRATGHDALARGPFIVAGNHSSLLDWVFVARFVERPIRFVLTREFYDQAGCHRALSPARRHPDPRRRHRALRRPPAARDARAR